MADKMTVSYGEMKYRDDASFARVEPMALGALAATGGVEEQEIVVVAPTADDLVASVDSTQANAGRP